MVSALLVLAGCSKPAPEEQKWMDRVERMRVMSFNVRSAASADEGDLRWDRRKYPCVKMLKEIQPDIIGFQETIETQIWYFDEALEDYSMYRIPKGLKQFANVIFYNRKKFRFLDGGYKWFSLDTPDLPSPTYPDVCNDGAYRTFMWVKLQIKGTEKVVWLFDTHLPWNPDKTNPNDAARKRCIETIVRQAKRIVGADETVFVVGDLNTAFSTDAGQRSLAELAEWMTPSFEGVGPENRDNYRSMNGFNAAAPYSNVRASIDHIFYRNAVPLQYRTVVSTKYGVQFLSDHYPICFDCSVSFKVPVKEVMDGMAEGYGNIDDFEWK